MSYLSNFTFKSCTLLHATFTTIFVYLFFGHLTLYAQAQPLLEGKTDCMVPGEIQTYKFSFRKENTSQVGTTCHSVNWVVEGGEIIAYKRPSGVWENVTTSCPDPKIRKCSNGTDYRSIVLVESNQCYDNSMATGCIYLDGFIPRAFAPGDDFELNHTSEIRIKWNTDNSCHKKGWVSATYTKEVEFNLSAKIDDIKAKIKIKIKNKQAAEIENISFVPPLSNITMVSQNCSTITLKANHTQSFSLPSSWTTCSFAYRWLINGSVYFSSGPTITVSAPPSVGIHARVMIVPSSTNLPDFPSVYNSFWGYEQYAFSGVDIIYASFGGSNYYVRYLSDNTVVTGNYNYYFGGPSTSIIATASQSGVEIFDVFCVSELSVGLYFEGRCGGQYYDSKSITIVGAYPCSNIDDSSSGDRENNDINNNSNVLASLSPNIISNNNGTFLEFLKENINGIYSFEVYNTQGMLMFQGETQDRRVFIESDKFSSGMNFVKLRNNKGDTQIMKLIKL
jgi:hypothetical protein